MLSMQDLHKSRNQCEKLDEEVMNEMSVDEMLKSEVLCRSFSLSLQYCQAAFGSNDKQPCKGVA